MTTLFQSTRVSGVSAAILEWILECLFVSLLLLIQNWSSPSQEMSSTPWHHLVLTSCWGRKAGTLLLAHSQSAQRQAPLFLELRPRGGDWSGLYFDMQCLLTARTWTRSQAVNVTFSVQNETLHAFLPRSYKSCSSKNHQDQVSRHLRLLAALLFSSQLKKSVSIPLLPPNNMLYWSNPEEEHWETLWCWWHYQLLITTTTSVADVCLSHVRSLTRHNVLLLSSTMT